MFDRIEVKNSIGENVCITVHDASEYKVGDSISISGGASGAGFSTKILQIIRSVYSDEFNPDSVRRKIAENRKKLKILGEIGT